MLLTAGAVNHANWNYRPILGRIQACREIKRVLAPGGIFALVTPGHSPLLDLGLRIVTGASPRDDFQVRRPKILPALYHEFVVDQRADYPPFAHGIRLYTALRLSVPVDR